ncbi:hypothetical protein CHS0354_000699 [Potamilus streckersoni]|uniref:ABC transporter domain-containing protein n=1 Tax=Potamilus streckersoni TaxID=2493646 RepID=A0AAE0T8A1_9BIVA|nr:hypothetical protein CHS0354_000699 [Potamilus streckersoni]
MEIKEKMLISDFSFYYDGGKRGGSKMVLNHVSFGICANDVVSLIGPSGCGKSTLLKAINRIHEVSYSVRVEGKIFLDGGNIYDSTIDTIWLRRKVGMVFQKPNPFQKSIFENVAFGLRIGGNHNEAEIKDIVELALRQSAIFDEVKDRLNESAMTLSGGQQQRLCIARALATKPDVLLMDEPCSALDPISTQKIEDLIEELKKSYTIIVVTHNMQQAARVSNMTAFMMSGELMEYGATKKVFTNPLKKITEDYISDMLNSSGISELREHIVTMQAHVSDMFRNMLDGFAKLDIKESQVIIEKDRKVDEMKHEIDRMISTLIALRQPVATDLRIVIASMKISTDLERIADHITLIAKSMKSLKKILTAEKIKKKIQKLGFHTYAATVNKIFEGALQSLNEGNTLIAKGVCNSKEEMLGSSKKMIKELMVEMSSKKLNLESGLQFIQILKELERIVSLSGNISEDVIYIFEGDGA